MSAKSRMAGKLLCGVAAATVGGVAMAQESAGNSELEMIVVQGTKYDQSLEKVTASVDLVTAKEIAREPITDLYDIVERIPNVNEAFGGQGFVIRGIDQRGIGSSGSGQTLTVYVDDAPLGNFTTFFGPLGSWDLGQVEVYRGPQSTNFGRNALAGAIYVRSQDPTYDPEFKFRAEVGDHDTYQIAAAGGGAIVEDTLAFRLSGDYRESDGFIENTYLDEPADATELKTLRGKLLFEPTGEVRIVSTTSYTENFAGEDALVPDGDFTREVQYDTPGREGTETFLQSVNARWTIDAHWELQSITSYQTTDYVRVEDFDVSPAPLAALDRDGDDRALAQEFRLKYAGQRFSGALGLYYVDGKESYDDDVTVPASILNPMIPSSIIAGRVSILENSVRNYALFFDGEYALTDTVDLLFGGLYDNEKQVNDAVSTTTILTEIPPGFEFLRQFEGTQEEHTEASYDALLPKLGVRWQATEATNFAFVVQKAYRAGGSEINVLDGSVDEFEPEYLWNYELSSRSVFLEGTMRFNANAFYSTWTDQQVSVPVSPEITNFLRTVNAGESTLYGFEADLTWLAAEGLEVYGSVGYVNTEFDDFPNPQPAEGEPDNFAGNAFPFASEWSFNTGFDYAHRSGVFGGVDVSHRSAAYTDQQNRSVNRLGAVTLVNARLGYRISEQYSFTAYARNLFDKDYYTNLARATSPGSARYGDPRTVALRLDARF